MPLVGEAEILAVLNTSAVEGKLAGLEAEGVGGKAATAGEALGADLAGGVSTGAKDIGKDTEEQLTKSTGRMQGVVKDATGKMSSTLSGLGVPSGLVEGWGGVALAGAAVAAVAVDLGVKMQKADAAIATAAGISVKAATDIGNAFLDTTNKFGGQAMAGAFAAVAGQLKAAEGHALSTKDALTVMNASVALATAKGIDLNTATSTLAATMQAFQIPVKGAAAATDVLFNASNATGQSVDTLGAVMDRVKSKMGAAAPPLKDLAGLLVDMTNHGETGRVALTALSSVFSTLQKPVIAMNTALGNQKAALASLPPSLKTLAEQYQAGNLTSTQLSAATKDLTTSQKTAFDAFKSATDAVNKATDAQKQFGITLTNSKGQMQPVADIISQLHDKIAGLTTAQATAELGTLGFKSSAAQLVAVIQAGPAAFDKATEAVSKHGSAEAAAQVAGATLSDQFDTLVATAKNFGTQLGQELLPIIQSLVPIVTQLAQVVGTVLKAAFEILTPVIKGLVLLIKSVVTAFSDLVNFVLDVFTGKWGAAWNSVSKIFEAAWNAIKTLVFKIPAEIFAKLPDLIVHALGDVGELLVRAGKDIMGGLLKGIEAGSKDVLNAVKHVGSDILSVIKDPLKIFSPSAAMYDVGSNITKGLASGITDGSGAAVKAAADMAAKVKAAASGAGTSGTVGDVRPAIGSTSPTRSTGSPTVTLHVHPGAVVIHAAPGTDVKSIETVMDNFAKQLATELKAGVTALGKVSA